MHVFIPNSNRTNYYSPKSGIKLPMFLPAAYLQVFHIGQQVHVVSGQPIGMLVNEMCLHSAQASRKTKKNLYQTIIFLFFFHLIS